RRLLAVQHHAGGIAQMRHQQAIALLLWPGVEHAGEHADLGARPLQADARRYAAIGAGEQRLVETGAMRQRAREPPLQPRRYPVQAALDRARLELALVTAEQLIAAVTGETHRHLAPSQPRQQ